MTIAGPREGDAAIGANVARHSWFRTTWLIGRREALELVLVWAAFVAIGWAFSEWVLRPETDNALTRIDDDVAGWFVDRRTPLLDGLSHNGSMLSDTMVKVLVTAVVSIAMIAAWKRWLEPSVVAVSLVLEAAAFITITYLVGRPRPDVPRLEGSPVNSSFPSGHVAAAAAYGAVVVVLAWHLRKKAIVSLMFVVVALIVVIVGWARMYRGMHHLSDIIAGVALGVASVAVVTNVMLRAHHRRWPGEPAISDDLDRDSVDDRDPDRDPDDERRTLAPPLPEAQL